MARKSMKKAVKKTSARSTAKQSTLKARRAASASKLDAITLEILRNRFSEICGTMEHLLFHSGYSTILRESHDGSAGILDRDGNTVDTSGDILHVNPYSYTVKNVLKNYPHEAMRDGDSFISNDPYLGGSLHVPDVAIVTPVFLKGEIIAFSCSIAHKPDVGGLVPGSSGAAAREIFHEGLLMPGVRYWTKDGVVREVDDMIKRNSRVPEIISGDLRAQVGCTKVGADKIRELCAVYGADVVASSFQELLRLAERRVSDGLKKWPDGEAEAEAWVDHDGVDLEKRLRLHVKVIKKGGRISVDFSGSSDQVKGPINLRRQTSEKAAMMALVATLDPSIPFNDGIRRAIDFVNPEGKITNGKWPSPVNSYFGLTHVLKNTISKALVEFCPDRAVACGGLGLGAIALGYEENRSGRKAVQYDLFSSAGGGTSLHDGSSGITMFNGTPNTPIEVIETEFPVRLRRFEWICDSGGPGKFRGGLGNRKDYELLGTATVTVRLGHQFENPGWGVLGGHASKPVRAFLNPGTDKEVSLRPLQTMTLSKGDIFRVEMPGGGGFGDPHTRDPQAVLNDVLDGFVSIESAARDYGVAVDVAARKVDEAKTSALRQQK